MEINRFKLGLIFILLPAGIVDGWTCESEDKLRQAILQVREPLPFYMATMSVDNIQQWRLRYPTYLEILRIGGAGTQLAFLQLAATDLLTNVLFRHVDFNQENVREIQENLRAIERRWAAYDKILKHNWSHQAIRQLFRQKGLDRAMIDQLKQHVYLEVFLDKLLGAYDVSKRTHADTQRIYDFPKGKYKTKEEFYAHDEMAMKGTAEYGQMSTYYEDIFQVMDVLRLNPTNTASNAYTGPLFDGKGFEGMTFIDLGSGYPRMGLFLGLSYPSLTYKGYEITPERVSICDTLAKEYNLSNVSYHQTDLSHPNTVPSDGNIYFIYDSFGTRTRDKVLNDLKGHAQSRQFYIVAVDGYTTGLRAYLDAQPWLVKVYHAYSQGPYGYTDQYGPNGEQVAIYRVK